MTSSPAMTTSRARALGLIALVVIGLAVRLALAEYVLRRGSETLPDTALYVAYAQRILDHQPYELNGNYALRTPGYPIFLAGIWSVSGQRTDQHVLWAQALLGTFTAVVVYLIARAFERSGSRHGWALLASAIAMFEPYGLILGTLQLSETLFTFLFVCTIYAIVRSMQRPRFFSGTWAGIFAGAAVIVRPSLLLLGPLAASVALLSSKEFITTSRYVLIMAITTCCMLGPWWSRNYKLFHAPVLTTLNVGESLYDGLNPAATGASEMSFTRDEEIAAMTEEERDAHWRSEAITWASAHPVRALELALIKFGRFWSPWPNEPRFRTPVVMTATTLYTIPLYLLAIVGMITAWRGTPSERTLVLLVMVPTLYFCGLHMIFVSSVRYRVVVLPLLSLLAAYGWAALGKHDNRGLREVRPALG